jgi:hypothetical protein
MMALTLMCWRAGFIVACGCQLALGISTFAANTDTNVAKQLDELYSTYLTGSVKEARSALDKAIEILESSSLLKPSSQAHGLWLGYSRLHVIATRAESRASADAYLLKAR